MRTSRSEQVVSDREGVVLATVIRGYVETAKAVGSRWVARNCRLGLSPASIRNCMMDLEEKGLLTHLHTSGGRLPTNAGYRYYVDALMKRAQLAPKAERSIDEALAGHAGSLEALLEEACMVLGRLSDQLAVVLSPRYDQSVVDRIELSQVDERQLLAVFHLSSGLERTVVVAVDEDIDSADLRETIHVMNMVGRDKSLADLVASRDDEETRVRLRGLRLAPAVYNGADELRNGEANHHFHLWGTSSILSQPEFDDRERLRGVFRALEEKEIVYRLFEPTRHRKNVCITIGDEMPVKQLRDCSAVAVSYRFGEFGGSVGVIGPTRMPYGFMVSLVDHVARAVGGALVRN